MTTQIVRTIAAASIAVFAYTPVIAGDPKTAPDVVGRDLNVFGLAAFGHVGIWTGSKVLEVLNEGSAIIYQNSLDNFKSRTKYWGARYGIGASNSTKVVNAGWSQRSFSPSYTSTTTWREGGIVKNTCVQYSRQGACTKYVASVSTALFRCDTFVDYAFYKGNNAWLVGGSFITPKIAYSSMPTAR